MDIICHFIILKGGGKAGFQSFALRSASLSFNPKESGPIKTVSEICLLLMLNSSLMWYHIIINSYSISPISQLF